MRKRRKGVLSAAEFSKKEAPAEGILEPGCTKRIMPSAVANLQDFGRFVSLLRVLRRKQECDWMILLIRSEVQDEG